MKILYGVQGTGNGHISRAREMAAALAARGAEVDYLFSGREPYQYFDMELFGDYRCLQGLSFVSRNGRLSYVRTALANNILKFINDVIALETRHYDIIISDFEPVTAWAAKLQGRKVLGLGHQYAFGYNIPRAGDNLLSNLVMRIFAPASTSLGLHWSAFDAPILPPIIDTSLQAADNTKANSIVVYLPFEDQRRIQRELATLRDYQFIIYSPELTDRELGNLSLRQTSHDGFKRDLASCSGVICNSGFELISECLHLGLAILSKPQLAQTEQLSNAAALQKLDYATVTKHIDAASVGSWLQQQKTARQLLFPDVANAICDWIYADQEQSVQQLSDDCWAAVRSKSEPATAPNTSSEKTAASPKTPSIFGTTALASDLRTGGKKIRAKSQREASSADSELLTT